MEPWLLLQVWGLAVAMQLMPCQGSRCGHQTAEPGTPNLSLCNPSLTPEVQNLPQSMWGHLGWLKLPLQTTRGCCLQDPPIPPRGTWMDPCSRMVLAKAPCTRTGARAASPRHSSCVPQPPTLVLVPHPGRAAAPASFRHSWQLINCLA